MVIALESSGYSWVERVGLRRAGVGLSRFALFLLVAFVGCQPILSIGPTPTPSAATPPTEVLVTESPAATPTPPPTTAVIEPLPSPTIAVLMPTSTPIALTPTTVPLTSTPTVSPTPESIVCFVGNTGGDGVYVRRTPNMEDRIKAWPDATGMQVIGPDIRSQGRVWKSVEDPDGNVGYLPAEYAICPDPTVEATPSPTPPPAQQSPTVTATSVSSPTNVPTATPTLTPVQAHEACPDAVPWHRAKTHVGERVSVVGPVVKTGFLRDRPGSPTVMEMGRNLRDPDRFTVEIRGQDRERFDSPPEHAFIGKTVCVTGWITEENGIASTVVNSPEQIVVVQPEPEE